MTLRVDLDGVGNIYRLCFVREPWAYFTRVGLDRQWGEGWDKAPYQLHAQLPYADGPDVILKVAFDGPLYPPETGLNGHSCSVLELNAGSSPWLQTESYFHGPQLHIVAGVTLRKFTELVALAGGTVFAPIGWGQLPELSVPVTDRASS
ncbi:hypothetical protein [Paraburkholderia hospita]|uniref:hypothetical protein n=1 Tax=Paraburkholderia hospita TaxID=169430 RepID=UPI000B347508|nr:hypothetical protein [Paraburkholderia hospita]OUL95640.1 hypothetical protein CA603_07420 [Paraburkholderia hospita]